MSILFSLVHRAEKMCGLSDVCPKEMLDDHGCYSECNINDINNTVKEMEKMEKACTIDGTIDENCL